MNYSVVAVGFRDLLKAQAVIDNSLADQDDRLDLLRVVGIDTGTKEVVRLLAIADGEAVGVAVGNVQSEHGYLDLIAVSADRQREGIGRSLLLAFEERAISQGARNLHVGGSTRRYVWPGIDTNYTSALSMLIRHGYDRSDVAFNMGVQLDSPIGPMEGALARLNSMGITVRLVLESDLPSLESYISGTFTASWAEEISAATRQAESGAFAAFRNGEPVGFAGYSVFRSSLFGPLATDPAFRGNGLGEVLLRLSLDRMREAGVATAQICWIAEKALPFYSRSVGAQCSNTFWIMSKTVEEPDFQRRC
jgi:ribosomal protein S18 acetylase RimI-like enzyme